MFSSRWQLLATVLLVPPAMAQASNSTTSNSTIPASIELSVTDVRQCERVEFTWTGATPPYELSSITKAGTGAGDIGKDIQGNSFSWINDFPEGTSLTFMIKGDEFSLGMAYKTVAAGSTTCTLRTMPTASGRPQDNNGSKGYNKNRINVGGIAGGATAGALFLLVIVGMLFYYRSKRKSKANGVDREKFEIERVPPVTPFTGYQAAPRDDPHGDQATPRDPHGEALSMSTSDSSAQPVAPLLLATKYPDLYDQGSSSGTATYSPPTTSTNALSPQTTTSSLPAADPNLPPGSQAPSTQRPLHDPLGQQSMFSNHTVREEEDAGLVSAGEVLPPRYNPEWEQRGLARDSQTGNN